MGRREIGGRRMTRRNGRDVEGRPEILPGVLAVGVRWGRLIDVLVDVRQLARRVVQLRLVM